MRAQGQDRHGGHRREFAHEHREAAAVQVRHPALLIWFGEYTQSYWVAAPTWLRDAETLDELVVTIWRHARHADAVQGRAERRREAPAEAATPRPREAEESSDALLR